jgi:ketosteroid isomerase-like protein
LAPPRSGFVAIARPAVLVLVAAAAILHACRAPRQGGKVAESPKVDVWRIDNGKIVAFHEYYDTQNLLQSTMT